MSEVSDTIEFKIEKTIPASVKDVFENWLDPKVPGTTWNAAEELIFDPKVNGLFYWLLKGTAHYGRFLKVDKPNRLQHTWMSPNTLGQESIVTVSFEEKGDATLMTLVHSRLPNHERARGHRDGWTYFVNLFNDQFGDGSRKAFNWDEAHAERKET